MSRIGKFSFKIVNASTSTAKVVLIPANYATAGIGGADFAHAVVHYHDTTELTAAGKDCEMVLDDGVVATRSSHDITCTAINSKYTIRHFLNFIKQRPQRCSEIVVQADNVDVYNESLVYGEVSPLYGTAENDIPLSDFYSNRQQQDDKIVMPVNMILSDKTYMMLPVPAGRTVRISFNKLVAL